MLYIQRAAATESKPLNLVVALSIYNLENGNSIHRWSLGAQLQNMALCRIGESNPKGVNSIRRLWNPLHLQHIITMSNDLRIKQKTKIFLHCIQRLRIKRKIMTGCCYHVNVSSQPFSWQNTTRSLH